MRIPFALGWILLAACGGGDPYAPVVGIVHDACASLVVVPPSDISADESGSLGDAIALWNSLGGETHLALSGVPEAARVPLEFKGGLPFFFGVYEADRGVISVNRILAGRERAVVIAHELGHAMSLPHINPDQRISVMNPANRTTAPTADDQSALIERWGDCRGIK